MLFAEWYQICEIPGANDGPCNHYIVQLHQNGLLKGDDMTERFFRIITVNLFPCAPPPSLFPSCYIYWPENWGGQTHFLFFLHVRNFLSHIAYLLRLWVLAHCNHLSRLRLFLSLPLIFMQNLCCQSLRSCYIFCTLYWYDLLILNLNLANFFLIIFWQFL